MSTVYMVLCLLSFGCAFLPGSDKNFFFMACIVYGCASSILTEVKRAN